MKRKVLLPLLLFVAVVAVGAAVMLWPRTVPPERCSALYRHYAGAGGIRATFVADKQVARGTTLAVTLLQATDSAGWLRLRRDFHVMPLDLVFRRQVEAGSDFLVNRAAFVFNDLYADSIVTGNEQVTVSYLGHSVCVFHCTTPDEQHSVAWHNVAQQMEASSACPQEANPLCHTVWLNRFSGNIDIPEFDTTIFDDMSYIMVFSGNETGIYVVNDEQGVTSYTYMFTYTLDPDGHGTLRFQRPDELPSYIMTETEREFRYLPEEQTIVFDIDDPEWEQRYGKTTFSKQDIQTAPIY